MELPGKVVGALGGLRLAEAEAQSRGESLTLPGRLPAAVVTSPLSQPAAFTHRYQKRFHQNLTTSSETLLGKKLK